MSSSNDVTPESVIENLIELKWRADVNIDKLLESGKLVCRGSGWNEVHDMATMDAVSNMATAIASNPTRVRLSKTTTSQARKLLERTRTDMLRAAAESFERRGMTEYASECRKLLRDRQTS